MRPAVAREVGTTARSSRESASAPPTTAGSSTSSHSAAWAVVWFIGTGPWPCRSCRPAVHGAAGWRPRSPSPSPGSSRR
ncbi:hypothetical protein [Ornithinimicrobium kibberense]|uniref:hypothetical protein n=1 Tax=Ornithinimicrobium kibberense TaxID=282060 RepID=UPI00360862FE